MLALLAQAAPAAAAAANTATDFNVGAELLRVVLSLAGIIGLIFAAGWLSKRLQARTVPGGRRIRCVETLAVGARDRVLLLEAHGKRLLVGAGPGGLRTLHVFDGELPPPEEAATPAAPVPGFAELLHRWKRTP
ncbi:flagellar biosynthetic protein FliO [Dyella ginsengisoli]|uniref:flagellar biosynthetic protein FliO n=1 Tax=Dyella ginsengisoli TaxID=363848 RepID=UPI0003495FE2|nr:flagellar biosynthetic protein FliO [Dyella ginsengisoli]